MILQLGSKSDEVRQVQAKLTGLKLYSGAIDGDFGGGTLSAVKQYQQSAGLAVDGAVGDATWQHLFGSPPAALALTTGPLQGRCLGLTGAFETNSSYPDYFSGISGDFDGQGMSYGVLQWNFGQNSLQPLLQEFVGYHPTTAQTVFGDHLPALHVALVADPAGQMDFVRSIQHPVQHTIYQPWLGYFKALGRTPEFQAIETAAATRVYTDALDLCRTYGLKSERAAALMFDIKTQNGTIGPDTAAQIRRDFLVIPASLTNWDREVAQLRIVANRRAEAANSRWVDDVRARKLCCANGGGLVHNIHYDLEQQFGIRLEAVPGL
jgi:Putative peptidoglycan binding domain